MWVQKERYKKKIKYNNEYNRLNYKNVSIRFHLEKDRDIIEWLENFDNNKNYISTIIRRDMHGEEFKKYTTIDTNRNEINVNKTVKKHRKKIV